MGWDKKRWIPITDEVYEEVFSRYRNFVAQLQEHLFTLSENCSAQRGNDKISLLSGKIPRESDK